MKRITVLLALFGALAVSGIATASALAGPEIKVSGGGSTEVSTSSGKSVLKAGAIEVECETSESTTNGTITNGGRSFAVIVLFMGCQTVSGHAACTTSGSATGSISTELMLLTIWEPSPGVVWGYAVNLTTHGGLLAKFSCGVIKAEVEGCVAAEITKVGGFSKTHKAKSILGAREAEEPSGTKFNCELLVNKVGKATEETTQTLSSVAEVEVV